jgi:hypothetical protein
MGVSMKNESPEFSRHCDHLDVAQYRVLRWALQLPIPWNIPFRGSCKKPQFLLAPCLPTPAVAGARANQWVGLGQTVAPLYAGDGGGAHRPRLDVERGAAVPRAALAAARSGVSGKTGQCMAG